MLYITLSILSYILGWRNSVEGFSENPSVCIIQADNRPELDYLKLSRKVNEKMADYLGYRYEYLNIDTSKYRNVHPATGKIFVVADFLKTSKEDIIVFLDSDAWVQNPEKLKLVIDKLHKDSNKHGAFSREPLIKTNTYINSGSFLLKNDSYIHSLYEKIIQSVNDEFDRQSKWPWDQYYVSNAIFENRADFYIYKPNQLNCDCGNILRHNCAKNAQMYSDLNRLIETDIVKDIPSNFSLDELLDDAPFPNEAETAETYSVCS